MTPRRGFTHETLVPQVPSGEVITLVKFVALEVSTPTSSMAFLAPRALMIRRNNVWSATPISLESLHTSILSAGLARISNMPKSRANRSKTLSIGLWLRRHYPRRVQQRVQCTDLIYHTVNKILSKSTLELRRVSLVLRRTKGSS